MDISHVLNLIESRYRGEEITLVEIERKIRAVVTALDIFEEPDKMKIRFSFGTPIFDEDAFADWKEDSCADFEALPDDIQNKKHTIYEIWYDSDDEYEELCGVEVMVYTR